VDLGKHLVIIEHHLDVMKQADWIIGPRPEGGERRGRIGGARKSEQIARNKKSTRVRWLALALNPGEQCTPGVAARPLPFPAGA